MLDNLDVRFVFVLIDDDCALVQLTKVVDENYGAFELPSGLNPGYAGVVG